MPLPPVPDTPEKVAEHFVTCVHAILSKTKDPLEAWTILAAEILAVDVRFKERNATTTPAPKDAFIGVA